MDEFYNSQNNITKKCVPTTVLRLGVALLRLGVALLRLGVEVRLGVALLRLGVSKSLKTQSRASPRCGFLRLGVGDE